jgi:hypothetical protein
MLPKRAHCTSETHRWHRAIRCLHSEYFLNIFQVFPYFGVVEPRARIDTKASWQHTTSMPIQAPNNNNKIRLRALWCGAVFYFFILLNELLHIREIPYVTLATVTLLNGGSSPRWSSPSGKSIRKEQTCPNPTLLRRLLSSRSTRREFAHFGSRLACTSSHSYLRFNLLAERRTTCC